MDSIGWGGIPLIVTGIGFALFSILFGHRARTLAEAAQHWPTATATITKSKLWSYRGSYAPRLRYTYHAAGQEYSGKKLRPGLVGYTRPDEASEVVQRYPVGAQVPVRYDPEKPKRAYLEATAPGREIRRLLIVGGIIALIGGGLLAVGLLHIWPDGGRQLAGDQHRWGHRQTGDKVEIYYDASTIERQADGAHVVERVNYKEVQENGASYMVAQAVYDCAGHRVRDTHAIFYDADGQRIGEEDWSGDPFTANRPNTLGATIERQVCA